MGILSNVNLNFKEINEEKEVYCVLKASVVNGQELDTELLGIYEKLDEVKKNKSKLDVAGHKTVVKAKMKIEPIEFMGDIENIK